MDPFAPPHPDTTTLPPRCPPLRRAGSGLMLAACLFGAASLVSAAEPTRPAAKSTTRPAARPAPAPKPVEPLLTREELRACMTRQDKLRSDGAEAARLQEELGREKAEILREAEALKVARSAVDPASAPAVTAFNTRFQAQGQRIAAFEPRLAAFNASVGTLDADRDAFARDCADRKFDEKDEKALQKGQ